MRVRVLVAVAVLLTGVIAKASPASASLDTDAYSWDYQTGDLSQWAVVQSARDNAIAVVERPNLPLGHRYAAKFTVKSGDHLNSMQTERAEVHTSVEATGGTEGSHQRYQWSTFFPSDMDVPQGDWVIFTQWHQDRLTCPPNVEFLVRRVGGQDRLMVSVRGGSLDVASCQAQYDTRFDLGPAPSGRWVDLDFRVRWSATPDRGVFAVNLNGREVVSSTPHASLYVGQSVYLKQGLYRSATDKRMTVLHTGTRRQSVP